MTISPDIFKAYDVRGLYPSELNEDIARKIGRAYVAYLGAKRIGVSRDMRLSSPSLAAAFIEGARAQGAHVIDYGMAATDMLYFGVVRDGLEGGAQITASHNPKQYNGVKMVRREAFPLSGDAGIGDIREMVTKGTIPVPTRPPGVAAGAGSVWLTIMLRISLSPSSPLNGKACCRTILMPLYCFGLWDAVICAPPSC